MKPLYWKEIPEKSVNETLPSSGKEVNHKLSMELVSDNPKVKKAWVWGGTSALPNSEIKSWISIEAESGIVFSREITPEQLHSMDIPEAITFINSL